MDYKLIVQQEAILDMHEAFIWYEGQKSGLGYSFVEEVENCFQKICENPMFYGLLDKWVRRIKVNGFPYLVIYEIDDHHIFVNSVWHTNKRPKY